MFDFYKTAGNYGIKMREITKKTTKKRKTGDSALDLYIMEDILYGVYGRG